MLNQRLKTVSEYIVGDALVDIGSDHAYLPIYAVNEILLKKRYAEKLPEDLMILLLKMYSRINYPMKLKSDWETVYLSFAVWMMLILLRFAAWADH